MPFAICGETIHQIKYNALIWQLQFYYLFLFVGVSKRGSQSDAFALRYFYGLKNIKPNFVVKIYDTQ
jgi:hypothetical protein